jgi:tetratricopeptide (TPR) repeat protein
LREHPRVFSKKPGSKFITESNAELKTIAPRKIIVSFKSLGYHFTNSIIALRLGFYHRYLFLHGVSAESNKDSYKIDKYFFIGIAVVLFTLSTRNIYLLWWLICIAQWSNVISFNQTLTNRYAYLPNIGIMLFISSLLHPVLALVLFTYYATKLISFIVFYKNEYWSIEHSCFEQPDFFYPWQNRSVHCFQNGNFHGALANMIKANELRPNDWKITYNLCQLYMVLGNLGAARDFYKKALACTIDGRDKEIGKLMERLGKWIEELETQAKANNNNVNLDLGKFDLQR